MVNGTEMSINVLHFVYGFLPGGTEHQLLQTVRLQQESGRYRVHLACLKRYGALLEPAERLLGRAVPDFPTRSFYGPSFFRQLRRFIKYLHTNNIDIIHTHDFYSNVFGMIGARLARVPVRIAAKRETKGLRTPAQDRLERGVYRLAHAIVANAEAVREHLTQAGIASEKIHTIYNGLDLARVSVDINWQRDAACAAFGLPPSRRFITIVASLRAVKGHETFLQAAQKVRDVVPDAAFVVAGEGELRDTLKAQAARLGLSGDVFFTGNCTQLADLLNLSYAAVLSSHAEGFSNSLLEYLAAGLPVVTTDVGGAREVVRPGVNGWLVAAGDDAQMAARLCELLQDPARAQAMGQHGRELVAAQFSCAAHLARTEELYEQLWHAQHAATISPTIPATSRSGEH